MNRRAPTIFILLLVCCMTTSCASGQTVLGKSSYDQWLAGFFNQNLNTSNLVQSVNAYAGSNYFSYAVLPPDVTSATVLNTASNAILAKVTAGNTTYTGWLTLGNGANQTNTGDIYANGPNGINILNSLVVGGVGTYGAGIVSGGTISAVQFTGGGALLTNRFVVKTTNYTTGAYDYFVNFDTVSVSTAGVTNTLPAASVLNIGKIFVTKDSTGNAASKNIVIGSAGGTIDGAATVTISTAYGSRRFYSDGQNWLGF